MKAIVLFLSLILCSVLNAQKSKVILSNWMENGGQEVIIPSDKYTFYEKGKLFYYLSNDNENIYFNIKVEDTEVQNRILKQGLVFWIEMDSKFNKETGIRFPVGSQYSGPRNSSITNFNPDGSVVTPLSLAKTIELTGFPAVSEKRFPSDNADNFRGSVKYDNEGTLHHKMIIPVSKLPLRNAESNASRIPFSIGIEIGALPFPNSQQGSGGRQMPSGAPPEGMPAGGGARSGGGGRSGGGPPGGGMPGGGPNQSQDSKPPVLFWIKNIQLATNK